MIVIVYLAKVKELAMAILVFVVKNNNFSSSRLLYSKFVREVRMKIKVKVKKEKIKIKIIIFCLLSIGSKYPSLWVSSERVILSCNKAVQCYLVILVRASLITL